VQFHIAGGHVGVAPFGAVDNYARHADAELGTQFTGQGMGVRADPGLEHHLGDATAVTQVDEHAATVVAPRGNPAEENSPAPHIAGAQAAAVMGALYVLEKFRHGLISTGEWPRRRGGRVPGFHHRGHRGHRGRRERVPDPDPNPSFLPIRLCDLRALCGEIRGREALRLAHGGLAP